MLETALAKADLFTAREIEKARGFLVHIAESAGRAGSGFVPVPSTFIKRHFRGLDWKALKELGLIEIRPYNRQNGQCREFRMENTLRLAYYSAGPTAGRGAELRLVDLSTGRQTQRRVKSDRRTPSGNALPPLVRAAIDAVGEVPFDPYAIERHLDNLEAAANSAPAGPARVSAYARYMNDRRCYSAVLTQGARPADPDNPFGIWIYQPAYRAQRFGRISQKGGGLQSCSKAMKAVAYSSTYPAP